MLHRALVKTRSCPPRESASKTTRTHQRRFWFSQKTMRTKIRTSPSKMNFAMRNRSRKRLNRLRWETVWMAMPVFSGLVASTAIFTTGTVTLLKRALVRLESKLRLMLLEKSRVKSQNKWPNLIQLLAHLKTLHKYIIMQKMFRMQMHSKGHETKSHSKNM